MGNGVVKWEVKERIGIITLNRPDKRNAINGEVLEGINQSFSEFSLNPEVRVILLQGAGAAFSAGIDFNYLATVARDDGRAPGIRLREGIDAIHSILNRIEKIGKPLVAKIHGFCGGLGCELALTADFRIASESATFGMPEMMEYRMYPSQCFLAAGSLVYCSLLSIPPAVSLSTIPSLCALLSPPSDQRI